MALKVIEHTPSIGATGVYRNQAVSIIFDRPIQPNTVTWDTISLNNKSSYSTVAGSVGVEWTTSGTVVEATFTPEINLLPNTAYTMYVFEAPNSVVALDGSEIATTYSWDFITGILEYDSDAGSGTVPSGEVSDTTNTGVLSGFYVSSTTPQSMEPNVDTNTARMKIKFNADVYTPIADVSGLFKMEVVDVLY